MQSVGLRFAAAMEWRGSATVQDVLPGLHVVDQRTLTAQIEVVHRWPVRGWCVVNAPFRLCAAAAAKQFNVSRFEDDYSEANKGKKPSQHEMDTAKKTFTNEEKERKEKYEARVRSYWQKQVLPLLNDHSIVLVRNAHNAPAADCFALIRLAAPQGETVAQGSFQQNKNKTTKRLLVAQLQLKDSHLNSTPQIDEETAKLGLTESMNLTDEKRKGEVQSILKRALGHQGMLKKAFRREYGELPFGAAMCMSRARPTDSCEPEMF